MSIWGGAKKKKKRETKPNQTKRTEMKLKQPAVLASWL